MKLIEVAREIAERFYDKNTYEHAMRVATFVTENDLIPKNKIENCVVLAIMHDLLEDTIFDFITDFSVYYGAQPYLYDCLKLLTRDKGMSYIDYLKTECGQVLLRSKIFPDLKSIHPGRLGTLENNGSAPLLH